MVRSTDRPAMTIAVDLGRKATKQTNYKKIEWKQSHWVIQLKIGDEGGINNFYFQLK